MMCAVRALSRRPTVTSVTRALPCVLTRALSTSDNRTCALTGWAPRPLSTAAAQFTDDGDAAWEAAFLDATSSIISDCSHNDSAAAMRALVRSGLLRHTDLRDRPERFFAAHLSLIHI